ncbi:MAG: SMI1/KNR4 family protein [Gammaproteobacteria bacterium]
MNIDKAYVLEKLAAKKALDPECIGFGVQNHGYQLQPPIEAPRLEQLERHYDFELPTDYRQFLLTVGNGGAGPSYGLYSIESSLSGKADKTYPNGGIKGGKDINRPFVRPEEFVESEEWPYPTGLIMLCQHGCANDDFLVVTGPERGFVWQYIEWTGHHTPALKDEPSFEQSNDLSQDEREAAHKQWVAAVLNAPAENQMTFSDWYADWLEKPPYILPGAKKRKKGRFSRLLRR